MPAKDLVFTVLGIDRASNVFDDVGRSMDRMSKTGTKSMASLLGASLGASSGIAAALGGVSVVFAGTAAAALSQNAEVAQSFRDLGLSMKEGLVSDAGVLEDEMVGAAESINAAFQEMRPQLREAFEAVGPHIENVVDGVTGFAREAMPGMLTAVQSAGPVMEGLESLLVDTGRGVGDFLSIVSEGAPDAGFALESLGNLAEGVLPNLGEMLLNLGGLWTEHGDQAVRVITNLTSVVSDLSSSALPTLSDGFGVALDVLEGLLNVIQPMSGVLGPLIGMWLSLSLAMRGLSAVRGVVDSVGTSVRGMRDNFSKSSNEVGKLTTAAGGVMSLLGGPWGLAVGGATALLALFGQESQENAAGQRSLAVALRESGGAFDEQARKALVNTDAYQKVTAAVDKAGVSQSDFVDALIKGGPALANMRDKLDEVRDANREYTNTGGESIDVLNEQGKAADEALGAIDGLREIIVGAEEDFRRTAQAVGGVSASMAGAKPGADSLAEAIGVLGDKTADTADRADALNTAWRQLLGIHIGLEEATANFEGSLDDIGAHLQKVKEGTENWYGALITADGQVNLSTEQGRQLSAMLIEAGEDYRILAQAAYDSALARGATEEEATAAAVAATRERRDQLIAEATQMFGNAEVAKFLADRYFGLPDDILTLLRADASNAQGVVDGFVNKNDGRKITMWLETVISQTNGSPGITNGIQPRALGGPVEAGQIYRVGEQGEELFMAPSDGTIVPNGPTRRFLAGLRAEAGVRARSSGVGTADVMDATHRGGRSTSLVQGVDEYTIARAMKRALQGMYVAMDGRAVGIVQGRQASLLGRTG